MTPLRTAVAAILAAASSSSRLAAGVRAAVDRVEQPPPAAVGSAAAAAATAASEALLAAYGLRDGVAASQATRPAARGRRSGVGEASGSMADRLAVVLGLDDDDDDGVAPSSPTPPLWSASASAAATAELELGVAPEVLERMDPPLRAAVASWLAYDKLLRSTRFAPTYTEEEQLSTIAGAEIHMLEAMQAGLSDGEIHGDDAASQQARDLRSTVAARVAGRLARSVQRSAEFARSVTAETFGVGAAGRRRAVRVADAVEVNKTSGELKAVGKFVDLRGGALRRAAALDVTREVVPEGIAAKFRLTLLGLIASLSKDSVFRKVQEAMRPMGRRDDKDYVTVREYMASQGVSGAAELVCKTARKYRVREIMRTCMLPVLTAALLPFEQLVYQVAWGVKLGAFAGVRAPSGYLQDASNMSLKAINLLEWQYRFHQVLYFNLKNFAGPGLTAVDHLQLVNAVMHIVLVDYIRRQRS